MPKGISLHIGVNNVSPKAADYTNRNLSLLKTCENDARKMEEIAKMEGFAKTYSLYTKDATRHNFEKYFIEIAGELIPGDLFLLTFSGHGLGIPDQNDDEDDGQDESWCLYDQILIDDDLSRYLAQIRQGVRVVVVSDSCSSGTMLRLDDGDSRWKRPTLKRPFPNESNIMASVVLLAACMDNYKAYAMEGSPLSVFTQDLWRTWNDGNFKGNYQDFLDNIRAFTSDDHQTPYYYTAGLDKDIFLDLKPFSIEG